MFLLTNAGGQALSTAPDVCNLPTPSGPVPTPYVNTAITSMAAPVAANVLAAGMPAMNMASVITMTQGDEAGANGGVCNAMIKMPAAFTTGSVKVMIAGVPAVKLTSMTTQNLCNTVGTASVPPPGQISVMVPT